MLLRCPFTFPLAQYAARGKQTYIGPASKVFVASIDADFPPNDIGPSLMARVRTATSMISFGFTIYKFFQFEAGQQVGARLGVLTPRYFALLSISISMVSLWVATIAHRKEIKYITAHLEVKRHSLAELIAGIVSVFWG